MGITAVIAAYNEEETISQVLSVLCSSPLIGEIIVVSDGSTDRTVEISRSFEGVRTISLHENHGKGYAMHVGVEHASSDVLFFVDGDMLNLTDGHIESLLRPVVSGECAMNVGIRDRGPVKNYLHLKMHCGPVLSGIRVMHRHVFEQVPAQYQERFKIELALNYFCAASGFLCRNTVIRGLGHVTKERKRGLTAGLNSRWAMVREVFLLHFDLYFLQTWRWNLAADLPLADYDLFEAELGDA